MGHIVFPEQCSPWSLALVTGVVSVVTETVEGHAPVCPSTARTLHVENDNRSQERSHTGLLYLKKQVPISGIFIYSNWVWISQNSAKITEFDYAFKRENINKAEIIF